jgi:hypothetical protein
MSELHGDDAALAAHLAELGRALGRAEAPHPSDALVERTLRLAAAELARTPALLPGVASVRRQLPLGFRRELARLVAAALPALALALAWAALLLRVAPAWLGAWLPSDVALVLVAAPLAAGLCALGLASAGLPLIAHRRALLRTRGAAS